MVVATYYCTNNNNNGTGAPMIVAPVDGNARVLVYDTSDMSLLESQELRGDYVSATVGNDNNGVHVVTRSIINSRQAFTTYFGPDHWDVYNNADPKDVAVYRVEAGAEAERRIPDFVRQFTAELDCVNMPKLALFQNKPDFLYFTAVAASMATITSFSASNLTETVSTASMLLPTFNWQVYDDALENRLVLAVDGWWKEENGDAQQPRQETYLITYTLDDGPLATATTLGTVPGYVLNCFSLDHCAKQSNGVDYLRVATSTQARWQFLEDRWLWPVEAASQLSVLEIPSNDNADSSSGKNMRPVVGQLTNLANKDPEEPIFSVRFQGDRAFVVLPKEKQEPFYTLDLSDPRNPRTVGELEAPSLVDSNYHLYPVGANLLLFVGDALNDGTTLGDGLHVSLYDVSDFSRPRLIQGYAETDDFLSSDAASCGYGSVRYLEESELLVVPVTVDTRQSDGFDGFLLYKIDVAAAANKGNHITLDLTIAHASGVFDRGDGGCWSNSSFLQARSVAVFGDAIVTFEGHSISSYNLTVKQPASSLINLDDGLVNCVPTYFLQ